jgi:hypothetical protein
LPDLLCVFELHVYSYFSSVDHLFFNIIARSFGIPYNAL